MHLTKILASIVFLSSQLLCASAEATNEAFAELLKRAKQDFEKHKILQGADGCEAEPYRVDPEILTKVFEGASESFKKNLDSIKNEKNESFRQFSIEFEPSSSELEKLLIIQSIAHKLGGESVIIDENSVRSDPLSARLKVAAFLIKGLRSNQKKSVLAIQNDRNNVTIIIV